MKSNKAFLAGVAVVVVLAMAGPAAWAADSPVGEWEIITDAGGQEVIATLVITEKDGDLSGTMTSDIGEGEIVDPTFEDGVLKFDITIDAEGQELALSFEGTIDGDSVDANWTSDLGDFPATGSRGGPASPLGEWEIITDAGGQEVIATLVITEEDGDLSGTMTSDVGEGEIVDPTFEDGVLKFDITIDAEGQELALSFEGTISGDSVDANWTSDLGDFPATGTRGGGGGSPAGEWEVVTDAGGQEVLATLTIVEEDGEVSGSISGDAGTQDITNASYDGGVLKFDISIDADGQQLDLSFEGTVDGDSIDGTWGSDLGDFPATATRE